jgi:hypothetical protein
MNPDQWILDKVNNDEDYGAIVYAIELQYDVCTSDAQGILDVILKGTLTKAEIDEDQIRRLWDVLKEKQSLLYAIETQRIRMKLNVGQRVTVKSSVPFQGAIIELHRTRAIIKADDEKLCNVPFQMIEVIE